MYSVLFILPNSVCMWSKTKPSRINWFNSYKNARYPLFSWLQLISASSLYEYIVNTVKKKTKVLHEHEKMQYEYHYDEKKQSYIS